MVSRSSKLSGPILIPKVKASIRNRLANPPLRPRIYNPAEGLILVSRRELLRVIEDLIAERPRSLKHAEKFITSLEQPSLFNLVSYQHKTFKLRMIRC